MSALWPDTELYLIAAALFAWVAIRRWRVRRTGAGFTDGTCRACAQHADTRSGAMGRLATWIWEAAFGRLEWADYRSDDDRVIAEMEARWAAVRQIKRAEAAVRDAACPPDRRRARRLARSGVSGG